MVVSRGLESPKKVRKIGKNLPTPHGAPSTTGTYFLLFRTCWCFLVEFSRICWCILLLPLSECLESSGWSFLRVNNSIIRIHKFDNSNIRTIRLSVLVLDYWYRTICIGVSIGIGIGIGLLALVFVLVLVLVLDHWRWHWYWYWTIGIGLSDLGGLGIGLLALDCWYWHWYWLLQRDLLGT